MQQIEIGKNSRERKGQCSYRWREKRNSGEEGWRLVDPMVGVNCVSTLLVATWYWYIYNTA